MPRHKPEQTGDLAAAIVSADRDAIAALAAVAFLVGVAIAAATSIRRLQVSHRAERAEWAFMCQQMEHERDRARFRVDGAGQVDDVDDDGAPDA